MHLDVRTTTPQTRTLTMQDLAWLLVAGCCITLSGHVAGNGLLYRKPVHRSALLRLSV